MATQLYVDAGTNRLVAHNDDGSVAVLTGRADGSAFPAGELYLWRVTPAPFVVWGDGQGKRRMARTLDLGLTSEKDGSLYLAGQRLEVALDGHRWTASFNTFRALVTSTGPTVLLRVYGNAARTNLLLSLPAWADAWTYYAHLHLYYCRLYAPGAGNRPARQYDFEVAMPAGDRFTVTGDYQAEDDEQGDAGFRNVNWSWF